MNEVKPSPWHAIFWPGMVVGLLVLQAVLCLVAIAFATADPSHYVEQNYHDRAIEWDAYAALIRAGEESGWTLDLAASPQANVIGERSLTLTIRDHDEKPVIDLVVQGVLFHLAHASQRQDITFKPMGDGRYLATPRMTQEGRWEVRLDVTQNDLQYKFIERFTLTSETPVWRP